MALTLAEVNKQIEEKNLAFEHVLENLHSYGQYFNGSRHGFLHPGRMEKMVRLNDEARQLYFELRDLYKTQIDVWPEGIRCK